MAGFKKAQPKQAALKIAFYGFSGSGKTFTSLLCAEGLARATGKKIAYIDTENGTDFYAMKVPERKAHPDAFEFDALYTRSITEALKEIRSLNCDEYGVVVIDSITHFWEAAKNSYTGNLTKIGTIPMHAWGKIKRPYKEMINFLMSSPLHFIVCGRQGNEFTEDEETGDVKCVGVKMKAEGETPYEPNILIHMEAIKNPKTGVATITAFAEKDRTGVLAQKTIEAPSFENLIKPILPLLGGVQAQFKYEGEIAAEDAEIITERDVAKEKESADILKKMKGRIFACETHGALMAVGKEITKALKDKMVTAHISELRGAYLDAEGVLKQPSKGPENG